MIMNEQLMNLLIVASTTAIPIVAGFATIALNKIAKRNGVDLDAQRLAKLNSMLVNGMNLAASEVKEAENRPTGTDLKAFIIARAINYVSKHGAENLAAIGADPNGPKDQEALKARAETLIADPNQPTPAVLSTAKK